MIKKKVIIISRNEPSSWKSCQSIVGNLSKVYASLFPEALFYKVPADFNPYQAYKAARDIREQKADLVIWLDHIPNAVPLLLAMMKEYETETKRPELLIHLFGDFVLDCLSWEKAEEILKVWPVHFIVASHAQKKLVENFFLANVAIVSVIPFPVDENFFSLIQFGENRSRIREEYSAGPDDKVFLFTGRLSFQKNIDLLLKTFHSIEPFFEGKIHLWIAGGMDDILLPYFGKHGQTGSHFAQLKELLEKSSSHVRLLGNCSSEKLVELYQAADVFVSMSTYNDEDYGMSPAEALCMGLPSLLSGWGGYRSFAKYSKAVTLVPVLMNSWRPLVDAAAFRKEMMAAAFLPNADLAEREEIREEAMKSLSLEASVGKVRNQIEEMKFSAIQGQTELFKKMCQSFRYNKFGPLKNEEDESVLSVLYKDVYNVYCD